MASGLRTHEVAVFSRAAWADNTVASLRSWSVETPTQGDAVDPVTVNLGQHSAFHGLKGRRYRGSGIDSGETNRHHHDEIQEYEFFRAVIHGDAVVTRPSLAVHSQAAMAGSLYGALGLSSKGNWLPRYSIGTPKTGGDCYRDNGARYRVESAFRIRKWASNHAVRDGAWSGNDTLWRTILDVNRALRYARPDGTLADVPQRETFAVVDAPVLTPAPLVVAGPNFAAVDLVCARLLGFDWRRIPHLSHVFDDHDLPLVDFGYADIVVRSDIDALDRPLAEIDGPGAPGVTPSIGWAGLAGGAPWT